MGNETPDQAVDGNTQITEPVTGTAEPPVKPAGWRPSRRLIIAAAAIIGVIALVLLTVFIVDQVTRVSVPSVKEQTLAEATAALEDAGLTSKMVTDSDFCEKNELSDKLCVVRTQSPAADERVHAGDLVTLKVFESEVDVPDMVGLTFADAADAAAEVGLEVRPDDPSAYDTDLRFEWKVLAQSQTGAMRAGSSMEVTLDRPLVDAPDVLGAALNDGLDALTAAGFTPVITGGVQLNPDIPLVVAATNPIATDGKLPAGSKVVVTSGVRVPNVVGMEDGTAKTALTNAGLEVKGSQSSPRPVTSQDPAADTIVVPGTSVTITLEPESTVYEVVGNGSRASVTWIPPNSYNISQDTNATLPWRMSFPTGSGYGNFNAQILNGNSVTCNIYVNGKLVKTATSTGQYAVVMCG